MLENYIKVAFRAVKRNKVSTLTSILGLSISMVVGVLLFGWVKSNWETDHFHPLSKRIVRITTQIHGKQGNTMWATAPEPIAEHIQKLSYIEKTTIVGHGETVNVLATGGSIPVRTMFTEPSFFETFGFRFLRGNHKSTMNGSHGVILNELTAKKIFGESDPMGQSIRFDGWGIFWVTGILATPTLRTHLPVEAIFSLNTKNVLKKNGAILAAPSNWGNYKSSAIYALTNSESDLARLNEELEDLSVKVAKKEKYFFAAQNIDEITPWNPAILNDYNAGMNLTGMLTWISLALGLTLLAAFNYTALSVARILARMKEVGIRKTNGAKRRQIFFQFVAESIMIALMALFVAYIIIRILFQSGQMSLGNEINVKPDLYFIPILLLYTALTGIIAGAVPAIILSRFKPLDVLKNLKNIGMVKRMGLQRAIIVVQFSVTTMLMIFFIILKDAGQNVQNTQFAKLPDDVTIIDLKGNEPKFLKQQIEQLSQVQKVSFSNYLPTFLPAEICTVKIGETEKVLRTAFIDANFIEVFNLKLAAGNNIPNKDISDIEQYVLLNVSAAKLLAKAGTSPNSLIGQAVLLDSLNVQVSGILSDDSSHGEQPVPSVLRFHNPKSGFISVKGLAGTENSITSYCKNIYQKNFPNFIPEVYSYKGKYIGESQTATRHLNLTFGLLCGIVMFVACLGIIGMANYTTQTQTISIGIRKTFGASNIQIIISASKPFAYVLLFSGMAGIPLGWFCGNLLKSRLGADVDTGISNLILGFGIVLAIALIAVMSQTVRSIHVNPARVLNGE